MSEERLRVGEGPWLFMGNGRVLDYSRSGKSWISLGVLGALVGLRHLGSCLRIPRMEVGDPKL